MGEICCVRGAKARQWPAPESQAGERWFHLQGAIIPREGGDWRLLADNSMNIDLAGGTSMCNHSEIPGRVLKPTQRHGSAALYASYAVALPLLVGLVSGFASPQADAAVPPVVTPVRACTDLLHLDFTGLDDAPTKLDSAVVVDASASNPTQQCVVTGYVAPKVKFTVRMPTQNWTQRLVTVGCGGY